MSHNQELSLARVCSREELSSFSIDVAKTEICVSCEGTASVPSERQANLIKLGQAYLLPPKNFAGIREEGPNKLLFAP